MELTFEDLLFVTPSSASSSRASSADGYSRTDNFMPTSYREPSMLSRPEERQTMRSREPRALPGLASGDDAHHLPCPGACHRKRSKRASASAKFYVDPISGVGKCHDPNCTWGYVDGDYIITDLRGYAYSAEGDPIMYQLPDGSTWKHVRLSSRR